MTNKSTTFKRISLALVAALGIGVLGSGQANAALLSNSTTLTLSASSASVAPGETATVTVTLQFTAGASGDSVSLAVDDATTNTVTENLYGLSADSANVFALGTADPTSEVLQVGTVGTTTPGVANVRTSAADKVVIQKATFAFLVPSNELGAGVTSARYVYSITAKDNGNSSALLAASTFTLTVSRDLTAVASKTKFWINQGAMPTTGPIEADSSLVVSAGATPTGTTQPLTIVGYIAADHRNAADTNVVSGANVDGNVTLVLEGPGALVMCSGTTCTTTQTAGSKSVTLTDTNPRAMLFSDGTAGTASIKAYIGSTLLTHTSGVKTVTFTGKAVTLTATANDITASGANLSSDAADSITVGTNIVTFTAKDSAGNAVTSASQNRNSAFYCISSDTSVVGASTTGAPTDTLSYVAAVYVAATGWECDMTVRGKGTATVTVADSMTVASSAYTSSAITIKTETKTGYTGTISFDKTSYNLGDMAIITVTSKAKTTGNNVGMSSLSGNASNPFTGIVQNRPFSNVKSGAGFGGGSGLTWDLSSSTFVNGVETYVVYMPTTSGKVTLTGFTSYESTTSNTAVSVSVDVVDPLEAVVKTEVATSKAAADAATAAADAATDAALQAIDAANAATDAANLAAEAADAATVAAEEAKDAADAATAAVEALATQVATLMAALQAQVRSLANTVAKIAKKVKA